MVKRKDPVESAGEILQKLCDEQDIRDMFDMFITSI